MNSDSTIFNELEARLTPNLDRDFELYKDQIKKLMASEIIKRYYFQKGELLESLKDDKVLEKAIEVLGNQELYNKTLSTPEEGDAKSVEDKSKPSAGGNIAYVFDQTIG